jgi:hypothetical protein
MGPNMKRVMILAAIPFVAITSARAEVPHNWQTYANGRFGYSICFPADLLRPQQESANGDGRAFVGPHGAKLVVWGGYNALEESVAQSRGDSAAQFAAKGFTITYQVVRSDWYVLSGTGKGGLFYQRTKINRDREVSFQLLYPANETSIWNPIAAKLSRCLIG